MARLSENPPAWVAEYVGLPFAEHGRRRRDGVDCWGLLRLVYAERYGVLLPALTGEYESTGDAPAIASLVGRESHSGRWRRTTEPAVGDAALFRVPRGWHVGVVVADRRMLHAQVGSDSCVERIDTPTWGPRLEGCYRLGGPVRVVGRSRPLDGPRIDAEMPAGLTVSEMLLTLGVPPGPLLRVSVGGVEVSPAVWDRVRPKPGRVVRVSAVVPTGGGGKDTTRLILAIAVVAAAVAAPFAAGALGLSVLGTGTLGGGLLAAGVGLGGMLLVNSLIPPPRPRLSQGAGFRASPTITGARNEARPYGRIPVILGRHRIAPLYAGLPWTEIVGDEQYLRVAFVVGYGQLAISEIKIGETPIESFEGVEWEVREGLPDDPPLVLYPGTVLEDGLAVLLEEAGGWSLRTSGTDAEELSIDVTWLQGLVELTAGGERAERTVSLEVEYAPAGSGQWVSVNGQSPDFSRGMDFLFREPEVQLGGSGVHGSEVGWGLGFAGTKPAYLPSTNYSWEASGYVLVEQAGVHEFGVDSSDAADVFVDDRPIASFYGTHGTQGGGVPDFSGHTGQINLAQGWHRIRVRVEARSTSGALALGWKRPGDGGMSVIPAASLRTNPGFGSVGLAYRWFDTSRYLSSITVTGNEARTLRRSIAWAVERGQYDVRIRRLTPDTDDERVLDKVHWTALRTIRPDDPIAMPGLAKLAVRIKATDQLAGALDTVNCVAHSVLPDWEPGQFGAWIRRATSNPASCYRAILQGPANARPLADDRLDLDELAAWHHACSQAGFEFNGVVDVEGTVFDRLADVASAGRASFGMRDGRYSIVRDRAQTVPVQHFTPRNSWGFTGRRAFPDLPHGLRVRFLNRLVGYQQDERLVHDDGYDESNATDYETIELFGVTDPDQVWKHGRYHIAVARLRPEIYELHADFEHLACTRGDLVLVTHDVTLWGLGSGRVSELVVDAGSNLTGLVLDDPVVMEAGKTYQVRVRLEDGTSWAKPVNTSPGRWSQVNFDPVSPVDPRPKVGDLWMFGELGKETRELLVRSIEIDPDLSARLTLVDHAPAVHEADQGEIPPWDSGITVPPDYEDRPEAPVIESIRSDDFVMVRGSDGTLRPRMAITLKRPSGRRPIPTVAQVRTREKPPSGEAGSSWTHHPYAPIENSQISVLDVEEGVTYQIRLRVLTADGRASDWVEAEHTVVGKSLPPPDLAAFDVQRLSDGTRRYSWRFDEVPMDLDGVRIRYGQPDWVWENMQALHDDVLQSSPSELNEPPQGTWRFAAKAVDTSGNESKNAVYVTRTLGPPRLDGVAFSDDAAIRGWPGSKTDCWITSTNELEAEDLATWDTLAAMGAATWDAYTRWNWSPKSPIRYEHTPLDAGFVFEWSPDAIATGDGILTVEVAWSVNGVDYTPWAEISTVRDVSVTARYLKARVTSEASGAQPVPVIRSLLVLMRAEGVIHEHDDLETLDLVPPWRLGPGDVRLPVPPGRFSRIRSVSLSFNGTGAGWSWELVDRDTQHGPRVRLFNAQGQPADATIDAVIRGL